MIHEGIDGYFRMPVYLSLSNNNKASTVLTLFKSAFFEYGLTSRVRCYTKVVRIMMLDHLCQIIQTEGLDVGVLLQVQKKHYKSQYQTLRSLVTSECF